MKALDRSKEYDDPFAWYDPTSQEVKSIVQVPFNQVDVLK